MSEEQELKPLFTEEEIAAYRKRGEIANVFYWQYIKGAKDSEAITAIQELLSYGGDLDEIVEKMALNM